MLSKIIDSGLFSFEKECESWQEAIKKSCKTLLEKEYVDADYADQIISCIEQYGSYIVIMPLIALPHTQEKAKGVNKTGVAFMKLDRPVAFNKEDHEADAQIFFTLASKDHDQHLENVSNLADMLGIEGITEELLRAKNEKDLRKIAKAHNI